MIVAQRIKSLTPDIEDMCDLVSLDEVARATKYKFDVIKNSTAVWLIRSDGEPVFIFGVTRGTFLGWGAEMWFLTCKNTPRLLRRATPFARRGIRRLVRLYSPVKSVVAMDFVRGQRFVEFFGFRRVGEMAAVDGKKYCVYEVRSSWLQQ